MTRSIFEKIAKKLKLKAEDPKMFESVEYYDLSVL